MTLERQLVQMIICSALATGLIGCSQQKDQAGQREQPQVIDSTGQKQGAIDLTGEKATADKKQFQMKVADPAKKFSEQSKKIYVSRTEEKNLSGTNSGVKKTPSRR